MDFDEAQEEIAFRAEVGEWLDAHAKRRVAGDRSDTSYMPGDGSHEADLEHLRACKEWQRTLYEGGWAGITWPVEAGGRGGAGWQQRIFNEEQSKYDVAVGVFAVGIGMAGPTIMAWATPEMQQRFLPPMLRGDEVWCQLFSEPGAGSDLAGLRTRAERDGDEWVVNGQKVWTSGAHYSDWGLLLARSDPDAPKHKGITAFLLDMRTPGIDVRPLRQITGASHFNEVFLTDVRVPDSCRVGPEGGGWRVANTMLSNERALIGGGGRVGFRDIVALAKRSGTENDPVLRQELARSYTRMQVIKWLGLPRPQPQGSRPRPRSFGPEARRVTAPLLRRRSGPRAPGRARDVVRRRRAAARLLAAAVPRPMEQPHRRRHRADPAQRDRRPGSRPAGRTPARQRAAVQRVAQELTGAARQTAAMQLDEFQQLMARTYGARDRTRGIDATVAWLAEELGELARAVRKGTRAEQLHELGDTLAWLASLAEQLGLSLEVAATRYASGCPRCGAVPCVCA